jgi:hypothetical protein
MAIVRVQGNAKGVWSSGSTYSVTLTKVPTNGNLLVLTATSWDTTTFDNISSITQSNVTWTKVISVQNGDMGAEIWQGAVGASASQSITITLTRPPAAGAIADVCEYSGLSGNVDRTETNFGHSSAATTGITKTTTIANELWVGAVGVEVTTGNQTMATNGFTLLDGAYVSEPGGVMSLGYLENIVSSTTAASSGVTLPGTEYWAACIATFEIAKVPTSTKVTCTPPSLPIWGIPGEDWAKGALVGRPTTCTAIVTATGESTPVTPTGTITFTSNLMGKFSSTSATLSGRGSSASCSVKWTPLFPPNIATAAGSPSLEATITAKYAGNTDLAGSEGNFTLQLLPLSQTKGSVTP